MNLKNFANNLSGRFIDFKRYFCNDQILIYQHTPKTGGSSLRKAIENQYKKSELLPIYGIELKNSRKDFLWYKNFYKNISVRKKFQLKCIMGHTAAGFVGNIKAPVRAFTILRDPVDRIISLYYYGLSLPENTSYGFAQLIKKKKITLEDIFSDYLPDKLDLEDSFSPFNEFYNGQTRSLLRPVRHQLKWFDCHPFESCEQLEQEAMDTALKIMKTYYTVGFQEEFKKSLNLFSREFHWKGDYYFKVNVTPKRPLVNELSETLVERIKKYNALDIRLYSDAYKNFMK